MTLQQKLALAGDVRRRLLWLRDRAEALLAGCAEGVAPTDEELRRFDETFRATLLDHTRLTGENN
jgi:hypothetical protein